MVVQCPSCQTKFRIADDKVTEKGVRVRCTSCKNVFQVKRSGTETAASQAATGMTQELQAISFGPPPAAPKRPPSVPPGAKLAPASAPPPRAAAPSAPPQRPVPSSAPAPAASLPRAPASAPPPRPPPAANAQPARPASIGPAPRPPSSPGHPSAAAAAIQAALSTPSPATRAQPISLSTASAPGALGRRRPSAFAPEGAEDEAAPPPTPISARPRPSADDLFGMDELTGESSALPGSPLSSNPNVARLPKKQQPPPAPADAIPPPPPLDEPRAETAPERPPEEAPHSEAPDGQAAAREPLGDEQGLPAEAPGAEPAPTEGAAVKLGAIKPTRRDPFDGLELADSGARELDGPRETSPAAPPHPEVTPQRPIQRELVAVLLSGAIGAAAALAVVAVVQFANLGPAWLRSGPGEPVIATQIASGLYDASGEKPLFFIRGRVENRGDKPVGPVRVIADLLGASGSMARVETVAGSEPSPEDVHALRTTEEAEALVRQLARSGADKQLAPGESLPFFALIADPPADAERDELRLRIEAAARQ